MKRARSHLFIYAVLAAMTLAVYLQAAGFDFTNTDDRSYITQNPHIQSGLTLAGVRWAFTSAYSSNWHPLTWMSHMLDWQIFGANPAGHHLVNILLHLVNVLLLFALLNRMTRKPWRCAFVAALFAVHPLHAESVAWVAERKDVLSTLFWMLTMLAYARYVEKPSVSRYLPVAAAFALGLMAKPMLVSLPLILLLLDYWPFERARSGWRMLLLEKMPLLALSAASCVATYWAQRSAESVVTLATAPVGVRIANALVAAVSYIGKMLCPLNLMYFYPHPGSTLPAWQVVGSALLLVLITALALQQARKRGYLLVGWLWYVVTLIPVVGLVQVGVQAMADRYTYVPLIGLSILIAWGVPDATFVRQWISGEKDGRQKNELCAALVGIIILGLAISGYFQVSYWRNSITLNQHAISVMDENYFAHYNLGAALAADGKMREGIIEYTRAIQLAPDFADAHYNLANALKKLGALDGALAQYKEALRLAPRDADACNGVGYILMRRNRFSEATGYLVRALKLDPNSADAHNNLGCVFAQQSRYADAISHFTRAIELNPGLGSARQNLENARTLATKRR